VIRTVLEKILGNENLETLLINSTYEINKNNNNLIDIKSDVSENNNDNSLLISELKTNPPEEDNINNEINIPTRCPECNTEIDMAGNRVISYNKITQTWNCSNCFASGR
jgi:predicted Zn-ribbon and HTH transcriptional regulator